MQYLLLFYDDERWRGDLPDDDRRAITREFVALHGELDDAYLGGAPLHPTETATTVRVREEEMVVTDGPFAETKEQLGGFFLIDVGSLEEARGWAARIPTARHGTVEVRPLFPVQTEVTSG